MAVEEQGFEESEMTVLGREPEVPTKAPGVSGWLRKAHGCFLFGQCSDQLNNTGLTSNAFVWVMWAPVGSQGAPPHICLIYLAPVVFEISPKDTSSASKALLKRIWIAYSTVTPGSCVFTGI